MNSATGFLWDLLFLALPVGGLTGTITGGYAGYVAFTDDLRPIPMGLATGFLGSVVGGGVAILAAIAFLLFRYA